MRVQEQRHSQDSRKPSSCWLVVNVGWICTYCWASRVASCSNLSWNSCDMHYCGIVKLELIRKPRHTGVTETVAVTRKVFSFIERGSGIRSNLKMKSCPNTHFRQSIQCLFHVKVVVIEYFQKEVVTAHGKCSAFFEVVLDHLLIHIVCPKHWDYP